MAERFVGRIHILQSKVCILLQGMPTNISVRKYKLDSSVILFIYDLFLISFTYSLHPANILAVFTATLTDISYIKNKKN
jgi:hypothetical protein